MPGWMLYRSPRTWLIARLGRTVSSEPGRFVGASLRGATGRTPPRATGRSVGQAGPGRIAPPGPSSYKPSELEWQSAGLQNRRVQVQVLRGVRKRWSSVGRRTPATGSHPGQVRTGTPEAEPREGGVRYPGPALPTGQIGVDPRRAARRNARRPGFDSRLLHMIECDYCGTPYDGTRYRWLCPVCKMKSSCCEGAPCPVPSEEPNKGSQ